MKKKKERALQPTHVVVQNSILFFQRHFWSRYGDLHFTEQCLCVPSSLLHHDAQHNHWQGKVKRCGNWRHDWHRRKDYSDPEPQ